MQLPHFDGFCHEVVHSGLQKLLPRVAHGVGGQGDDGDLLEIAPIQRTDVARGLDAVHLRHHVVHEDRVIAGLFDHFNGLEAAGAGVDLHPVGAHQALCHLQVRRVVVHDQDAGKGEGDDLGAVEALFLDAADDLLTVQGVDELQRDEGKLELLVIHVSAVGELVVVQHQQDIVPREHEVQLLLDRGEVAPPDQHVGHAGVFADLVRLPADLEG